MSVEIEHLVWMAMNIGILIGAVVVAVVYIVLFRQTIREFSDKNFYPWEKKKNKNANKRAERQRRN